MRAANQEQPIHPLFAYLYVADKYEGLILINIAAILSIDTARAQVVQSILEGAHQRVHHLLHPVLE